MKCSKSSAWMTLLLPLIKRQHLYLEIILHILQDYDTDLTVQLAVQPWIWKSESQGAYIHGNASSALMPHTSNGGWSFLRILLSSYRNQQTNLVLSWWAKERHALDSSSRLLFTDWAGRSESERPLSQRSFFPPTGTVWLCVWPVFHTFTVSLRDTYQVACQSRRK